MSKPPRRIRHSYNGIELADYISASAAWIVFFLSFFVPTDTAIYFVITSGMLAIYTSINLLRRL